MAADDGAAAAVALQRPQLRKEAGGEQAGIAPDAVVSQRRDAGGMSAVKVEQPLHAGALQQRLVGHQKQRGVAVFQRVQAKGDGVADAPVRVVVFHGREGEAPCGLRRLRILGDDRHPAQPVGGYGLQRAAQEGLAVHLRSQLVLTEAGAVAGGHNDTADTQLFHGITSMPVVYPQNGKAVKKNGVVSQVG